MSQVVCLQGKHTVQRTHCALLLLLDVLETDYINMEDGDFVFAGGKKVPHHRIILSSAASPAFNIQGHGAEKTQGGH